MPGKRSLWERIFGKTDDVIVKRHPPSRAIKFIPENIRANDGLLTA